MVAALDDPIETIRLALMASGVVDSSGGSIYRVFSNGFLRTEGRDREIKFNLPSSNLEHSR